jgi:hypothetical protein
MKHVFKSNFESITWAISIALLLLLGISASLGGLALVIDPTGNALGLSVRGLSETFFTDYEAPGMILFFAIGILSLITSAITMFKRPIYPTLVFTQGAILTGWILAQVYLLPENHLLQIVYFLLGLFLMLLGSFQRSKRAL